MILIQVMPTPIKKLKSIFWDHVPHLRLAKTFWVEQDDEEENSVSALDFGAIEEGFAQVTIVRIASGKLSLSSSALYNCPRNAGLWE